MCCGSDVLFVGARKGEQEQKRRYCVCQACLIHGLVTQPMLVRGPVLFSAQGMRRSGQRHGMLDHGLMLAVCRSSP